MTLYMTVGAAILIALLLFTDKKNIIGSVMVSFLWLILPGMGAYFLTRKYVFHKSYDGDAPNLYGALGVGVVGALLMLSSPGLLNVLRYRVI